MEERHEALSKEDQELIALAAHLPITMPSYPEVETSPDFMARLIAKAEQRSVLPTSGRYQRLTCQHGNEALRFVREAKKLIRVTHFTTTVPTREYRDLFLEKAAAGVFIERIVARCSGTNDQWIEEDSVGKKRYREYVIDFSIPLDVLIIDRSKVIVHFTEHSEMDSLDHVHLYEDPKEADIWSTFFLHIASQAKLNPMRSLPKRLV